MSSNYSKIKTIAEDTELPEYKVAMVLYSYLTWCLQEVLIDGNSQTLFGKLSLNEENRLKLENDIQGLISLIGKSDIKLIRKICEEGPDFKIFE
jgi:hypothetical protein|nr:MAG TPA: hypothetical protein [Caudoviricetes sp.]